MQIGLWRTPVCGEVRNPLIGRYCGNRVFLLNLLDSKIITMISGEIKNRIGQISDSFCSGGIPAPVPVVSRKTCLSTMKHLLILFLFPCLLACSKEPDPYGTPPQPGTFNLTTVITDAAGKSVDIAGDWAVFTEPEETRFNKFIQFTQDSETVFDIQSNEAFMLEYKQDRETLPVYSGGKVDEARV